ncbi:MAG: TRAP transporter solute receptor, TAXI family precursor [Candidatus Ozemobacter sibiricus]|jgi:TRAP transporter TAXI family solute receptor|uniref:TRAP transporter solute receptor, TAXI family n=1 Tax=Candidatus Ozemobacter sibiricus TaxID=2268124 RepID=A0A367ZG42_9BACT|nr:MAG: TRAP transporter solute receptor, TAXI family precursor [Candidatus Ozemobacter sibiricus]
MRELPRPALTGFLPPRPLIGLLGLALLLAGMGSVAAQEASRTYDVRLVKRFFSIGTASISGMYYPLGSAMSRLFNSNLDGIVTIPEPTKGSVDNIEHLRRGEIALALVQNDVAFNAFHGRGAYEGRPMPTLRVLASLYSEVLHVAVRQDAGLRTFDDLRGKVLAIGEEGSGTAVNSQIILEQLGFKPGDFTPSYLGVTKAIAALEGGYVDAVFFTGGLPSEGFALLGRRLPIRLLSFSSEMRQKVIAAYPFWQEEIIPAGTYPGQTADVATVGLRALLCTTAGFDPDLGERMLALIFDQAAYLATMSRAAAGLRLDTATKGVPPEMLHPATRQFLAGRGFPLP